MPDTIQVVRVDGIPLGPLEDIQAIVMQYTDRLGYVLELTEEAEEFDDENDRWLRTFSSPVESDHDDA